MSPETEDACKKGTGKDDEEAQSEEGEAEAHGKKVAFYVGSISLRG